MLDVKKIACAVTAVCDQFDAMLREHEAEAHGGGPCLGSRVALAAHVAYRLGLDSRDYDQMSLFAADLASLCLRAEAEDKPKRRRRK